MEDLDDTIPLALNALESSLRRRSDRGVKIALEVAVCRVAGRSRREIEEMLGLSRDEYARAHRDLREAYAAGADADP